MELKIKNKWLPLLISASIVLSGCESMPDMNNERGKGAAIGGVAGALLGHQTNAKNGALYGAILGAAAGGLIGDHMVKKREEAEAALAREIQLKQARVEALKASENNGKEALKVTLAGSALFATGRSEPLPEAYPILSKVAEQAKSDSAWTVHVVGYTDNVGSAAANQQLSVKRARAIEQSLRAYGISAISSEGRGPENPVASNNSDDGRQQNRRVEIYLEPHPLSTVSIN